ncbi:histone-lysine N-methyltransferase, H3 lysine-79 specific-like [Alosa sapidissima]|uniref:histone-lysine N-methyltransferase, H3 lysine-79 specific-like n=1 Tax=Alosa sapidissima TaxID=34773 RepID=UPI001C09E6A2|nr:histone-lysine N-methyltransferase, H3 lysine-79 specific-like [Alosa sapidissima]XP_041924523.1 histone-lysine N-methyltransferase, H3 lysine-79 specific-like [Alosa sapidissima]XP_041924524.1 histone-lysine N-methyltransferase, H3 lysine-79 specific-like [Alosa sapidissima]
MAEALIKEMENLLASKDQQLKKMKVQHEQAACDMMSRLRETHERLLGLQREKKHLVTALEGQRCNECFTEYMSSMLKNPNRLATEIEDMTLSGALSTAVFKQRLLSELRTLADTWMLGNASENTSVKIPSVFLKWSEFQGNQAIPSDDSQNLCLSKDMNALLQQYKIKEDTINQKFQEKIEQKEAKLLKAKIKELAKLEKEKTEKMEKIQKAELKEEKKRQLKERKQREQMEKKEATEQKKAEAKRQRDSKRAERERRRPDEAHSGWRRFFCF